MLFILASSLAFSSPSTLAPRAGSGSSTTVTLQMNICVYTCVRARVCVVCVLCVCVCLGSQGRVRQQHHCHPTNEHVCVRVCVPCLPGQGPAAAPLSPCKWMCVCIRVCVRTYTCVRSHPLGLSACFLCSQIKKTIKLSNTTFSSENGGVVGEICPI